MVTDRPLADSLAGFSKFAGELRVLAGVYPSVLMGGMHVYQA